MPPIESCAPWRIRDAHVVEHGLLDVEFVDGTRGRVDLRSFLACEKVVGTVFEPLRDPAMFSQVVVHFGAVEWPGEVDLAPDAMYDAIRTNGEWILNPTPSP